MDVILGPLFIVIDAVLQFYIWVVVASVILSWLTAFRVINTHNRFVYMVGEFVYRLTEPPLRYIRGFMPNLGGLDLSPMVLLLGVFFLRLVLRNLAFKLGV